ncbi:PPC domain-containing DNA-binding protein [Weissella soli]|uniref:PPC domain-containing DNA-binding protein n=1 Tax=Weissella soli TaxID=155866 RepID=UPI0035A19097
MYYQKSGDDYFLRVEKGEEVLESILALCQHVGIKTTTFQGIGACDRVVVSTYIPEKADFIAHEQQGMLEMVSLMGNIRLSGTDVTTHAHGSFSYLDGAGSVRVLAGHLTKTYVSYTAEIRISPATEAISLTFDPTTGIDVWHLANKLA